MSIKTPIVVTITGPSTAGKSVLSHALIERGFEHLVSTTTRDPRQGEENGVHYNFVTKEQFAGMRDRDELIEEIAYNNHLYGVSAYEVTRAASQGKPAVLVAEPHGTEQIREYCAARGWISVRIFVNNPKSVLIDRLLERFFEDVNGLDVSTPEGRQAFDKKKTAHGSRLEKILTQEQEEWVAPAYDGRVSYDLVIDRFDADNTEEVIAQVRGLVESFLQQPAPKRKGP